MGLSVKVLKMGFNDYHNDIIIGAGTQQLMLQKHTGVKDISGCRSPRRVSRTANGWKNEFQYYRETEKMSAELFK